MFGYYAEIEEILEERLDDPAEVIESAEDDNAALNGKVPSTGTAVALDHGNGWAGSKTTATPQNTLKTA